MDLIRVDGAQLASLALGTGPAVVLLHGLAKGNMATWFSTIASPLSARRRVILYDQRGHGSSTIVAHGFDLDTQADDLDAVLQHHAAGPAVDLVGHSMGALIALRYALRQPHRVRRMVLIDAPMPARDHVAPSLRGAASREALAAWIEQTFAADAGDSPRRRERLRRRLDALFFDTTLIADVSAMDAETDAALAALQVPVRVVVGARSPCRAAGERLARSLPRATLRVLDCGHYVPEEAPSALLGLLDEFLDPHPAMAAARATITETVT